MKCAKCGYFSFDYLSECKKCRTNLEDARQRLGFSGVRPAIPSMLGSLLRDSEPAANQESEPVEIAMSSPLDFEEGFDATARQAEPENTAAVTPPAIDNTEEAEEDFSLLDLTDEELDLLIDKGTFQSSDAQPAVQVRADTDDADFTIPESLLSAEPASPVSRIEPTEGETPSEEGPGDVELILEPGDYLPQVENEPAAATHGMPDSELTLDLSDFDEGPELVPTDSEASPEPAIQQCGESGDDFVIELSEDDLDNLLEELSHPPKGEAGVESKR